MIKKRISEIRINDSNPRKIDRYKLNQLKSSLTDFPKMMEIRPIVIDEDGVILGGNMRFLAATELGWDEVPVEILTIDDFKKRQFIVKDNLHYGEWNWTELAEDFKFGELSEWGLEVPLWYKDIEASIRKAENEKGENVKEKKEKDAPISTLKAFYLFYTKDQKNQLNRDIDYIRLRNDPNESNEKLILRLLRKKIQK